MLRERTHWWPGRGGLVLLDGRGNAGYAHDTQSMAHAYMAAGMAEPKAGV